jgi:hypothetical protein
MILTWMLCLLNFQGYRIPSSQAPASPSLSTAEAVTDSSAPSPSSCAASARSAAIRLQGPKVLQVALAGMCSQYCQIYLLVVHTIGQTLAVINVRMLRALVTEVLRPSKQQNITQECCAPFRNSSPLARRFGMAHVFLEHFKQLHGYYRDRARSFPQQ